MFLQISNYLFLEILKFEFLFHVLGIAEGVSILKYYRVVKVNLLSDLLHTLRSFWKAAT